MHMLLLSCVQVNRELMDAIEKLQSTVNEDDGDTECSSDEEANATDMSPTKTLPESSGIEIPPTDAEDMHTNVSEENSENETEQKPNKTHKRRKTEAGESSNSVDNDVTDNVSPSKEPCHGNNLQVAEENGHVNGDNLQANSDGNEKPKAGRRGRPKGSTNKKSH